MPGPMVKHQENLTISIQEELHMYMNLEADKVVHSMWQPTPICNSLLVIR